jgi:hypothetical protein
MPAPRHATFGATGEGHSGGVLGWSSVRWSMTQARRAVSGTSSTGFELVDNGEGRVLEDVAAWSESFLYREFNGALTGRLL